MNKQTEHEYLERLNELLLKYPNHNPAIGRDIPEEREVRRTDLRAFTYEEMDNDIKQDIELFNGFIKKYPQFDSLHIEQKVFNGSMRHVLVGYMTESEEEFAARIEEAHELEELADLHDRDAPRREAMREMQLYLELHEKFKDYKFEEDESNTR